MQIQDLDILRPSPKFIRIGGKDIDVSFIPCGITFEIDLIVNQLRMLDVEKITNDSSEIKKAFDLSIKLCSAFCSWKNPEMDCNWFYENTSPNQIEAFSNAIKEALVLAYAGTETEAKNLKAAKKRTRKI